MPLLQMANRLLVRGVPHRVLGGALTEPAGALCQPRPVVVACHEPRILAGVLGEALFQDLDNPPVVAAPRLLGQRLIGDLLNQGVFEAVAGVRRNTSLIQKSRID